MISRPLPEGEISQRCNIITDKKLWTLIYVVTWGEGFILPSSAQHQLELSSASVSFPPKTKPCPGNFRNSRNFSPKLMKSHKNEALKP